MDEEKINSISFRDILHVVFKRKIQILLFFSITVFTVAIGTYMVRPTYEATAQLLVKTGRENIYVPTLPAGGISRPVVSFNREEQINSEIEILRSLFLAEKVVEFLGPGVIYEDMNGSGPGLLGFWRRVFQTTQTTGSSQPTLQRAAIKLQKGLTVKAVLTSHVINIRFKHRDPHLAATTVDTLVRLYLDRHLQIHRSPHSNGFFRRQSEIVKRKLKQAEENLETFKEKHHLTSLEEERSLLLRQEADFRTALNQILSQEVETESRLRQLRHQLATTPKTIPLSEEIDHNPLVISSLQAKLVELKLKEHELLAKYTAQSHLVQSIGDSIAMVQKKLAEQEARRHGRTRIGVSPVYQTLEQELFRNQAELKALRAKKESYRARTADYQKGLKKLNRLEMEFNHLQQEVAIDRQNYRLYLTKFEESRISDAMDTEKIANVKLIEPAKRPLKPVSPRIRLNMVLAVFLGGFGAVGLAFFFEYLNDSLEKEEDVENYLRVPVLASIPELKT